MALVNTNDILLSARMRELCRPPTAWNRALWAVSTQTVLREVLEASLIRREGILSDGSLSDLQNAAGGQVRDDPGVGDKRIRGRLLSFLHGKAVITPGSLAAATIHAVIEDIDSNYLDRWAQRADQGLSDDILEQCARGVVSHLLNRGHAARLVSERIKAATASATISTAGDLIRDLQSFSAQNNRDFVAVFPVGFAPLSSTTSSEAWMKGAQVVEWMKQQGVPRFRPNERLAGAISISVPARDHVTAGKAAVALFEMICKRAILGARKKIQPLGYYWLAGFAERFPIKPISREVEVASLFRRDRIYSLLDGGSAIGRAIALLAELDHGPAAAAVTSGWAALESLSIGPAESVERVETAIRSAALIAASFPRAELTTLAHAYVSSQSDALADQIRGAGDNKQRVEVLLRHFSSSTIPTFIRIEDNAAAKRMMQLIKSPEATLRRVQHYIEMAFKRLYRLRNLVAHGARTDSVVLEAGLDTAAPLVGAAFDRIHHASMASNISPVELIARATLRLATLDPTKPQALAAMLD
jgi:hypothetical protein